MNIGYTPEQPSQIIGAALAERTGAHEAEITDLSRKLDASRQAAIGLYRAILENVSRAGDPLVWAAVQGNPGNALRTLGQRENDPERLEAAVAAYRAALEEWTRDRVPLQWAATQDSLGTALSTLGERDGDTDKLEEAIAAFDAALSVITPETAAHHFPVVQRNRARVLALLEDLRATQAGAD